MDETAIAELSRLRAFAAQVGPIVKAALELRQIGMSCEEFEKYFFNEKGEYDLSHSYTPGLILNQAYDTALEKFDETVRSAALGNFKDLIGIAPATNSNKDGEL